MKAESQEQNQLKHTTDVRPVVLSYSTLDDSRFARVEADGAVAYLVLPLPDLVDLVAGLMATILAAVLTLGIVVTGIAGGEVNSFWPALRIGVFGFLAVACGFSSASRASIIARRLRGTLTPQRIRITRGPADDDDLETIHDVARHRMRARSNVVET